MTKFERDALAVLDPLNTDMRSQARALAAEFKLSEEGQRLLIRKDTVDPLPRSELEALVGHLRKALRV